MMLASLAGPKALRPGFSLLEMLVTLVIFAIVSAGVFGLFYSNHYHAVFNPDLSSAMSDTQTALRRMGTDFQSAAGFQAPSYTPGVRVTYASGTVVEFYQSGSALKRRVATTSSSSTETIATGLISGAGLSLKYYDSNMNAIAAPMDSTKYAQAAVVDVTLTLTLAHSYFGRVTRTTRILLRNKVS